MNILVIEDDPRVSGFLQRGLRAEGYGVQIAVDGPAGIEAALRMWAAHRADTQPCLILLDLMLPVINGSDICQTLRAGGVALPILMLSALGSVEDRILGLRMGADDYMVKPFAFEELLARIEALLRRGPDLRPVGGRMLVAGDVCLDRDRMRVTVADEEITLTAKELALLELLLTTAGRVLSRERILANVWGASEDPLTNVVDVYVSRLRAKLGRAGEGGVRITTVRGLGYRLDV